MAQDAGALTTVCQALRILGEVSHREGDLDSARELLEASLSAGRRVGDGFWVASVLLRLAHVALDQGQAPEAATLLTQSLVLFRELGDRPSLARSLVGLARVAAAQRQFEPSLQFAAAAEVLAQSGGFELDLDSRARRKHDQALARAALGQRAAARAWTAGQALSLDQMMELASRLAQQLANPHLLTPREREVAMLVARGLSNHRIAQQLTISEKTAAKHVARILDKLALDSRAQLAARAAELGLKTPEVALAVG
jgi:DNA-binding CsgD family transcriptional regulator